MSAQAVQDHQGYCQHKFHYYRNGIPGFEATAQEIEDGAAAGDATFVQRWADVQQRTASLPGLPGGLLPPIPAAQFAVNHRNRLRGVAVPNRQPLRTANIPLGGVELKRGGRKAVQEEYTNVYGLMRATFRYIKCLGWGGDGIASMWRYSPGPGQEHIVVMKMSDLWEFLPKQKTLTRLKTQNITRERDLITKLGRAPHIVQRFYTAHHPRVNPPRTRFSRRQVAAVADQAQKIDGHQGSYFLMEYCKFGNLESQLQRAARDMPNGTERYLEDPVLWRFFDCLVKACMAMEEPPRLNPALGAVPAPTRGGYMAEVITAGNPGREGIVHFDLDPSNVFVYGYDTQNPPLVPAHTIVPRLQVGDFGFARDEASIWAHSRPPALGPGPAATVGEFQARERRWRTRHDGKFMYYLPEQFGKDWDIIPRAEDPSDDQQDPTWQLDWMPPWMQPWAPPPPITTGPGRYSSASNVWQIGMVMKVAMTLLDPDLPPYAGRMTSQEPANPAPDQERWTYGWSLLDPTEQWNNQYQQGLIDLVARCLMAKQEHRPTLQQLQTAITVELALPANQDQNVDPYWTNTFFRDPPPPQPPPDTESLTSVDPFMDYVTMAAL